MTNYTTARADLIALGYRLLGTIIAGRDSEMWVRGKEYRTLACSSRDGTWFTYPSNADEIAIRG